MIVAWLGRCVHKPIRAMRCGDTLGLAVRARRVRTCEAMLDAQRDAYPPTAQFTSLHLNPTLNFPDLDMTVLFGHDRLPWECPR